MLSSFALFDPCISTEPNRRIVIALNNDDSDNAPRHIRVVNTTILNKRVLDFVSKIVYSFFESYIF